MNILILCTGNSARSILAEALFNHHGADRISAYSAGSKPAGHVNPGALRLLAKEGYALDGYRSKSWDEFAESGAPVLDLIITVCDNAAAETCPLWPGAPISAHWGVPDPAAVTGSEGEIDVAFQSVFEVLQRRVLAFLDLLPGSTTADQLRSDLDRIGTLK